MALPRGRSTATSGVASLLSSATTLSADDTTSLGQRLLAELPADLTLTLGRNTLTRGEVGEELERRGWKIHKLCDALIDELVRSTSEAGNLKALRVLQASGAWRPEESTLALQVAHEAGTLTHLLTSFQLPLGDYPAIAQAHEEEALDILNGAMDLEKPRSRLRGSQGCGPLPTQKACLLANFLLVPGSSAELVMRHIVEHMVCFHPVPCSTQPPSESQPFPKAFGPIGMSPWLKDGLAAAISYNSQKRVVRVTGVGSYPTSCESIITLTGDSRNALRVPSSATTFAFVYGDSAGRPSAFLYLDGRRRPCALYRIAFDGPEAARARTLLSFGAPTELAERCAELFREGVDVDAKSALLSAGARKILWLSPEQARDLREDGPPDAGRYGGFAFLLDGSTAPIFFPLVAAGPPRGVQKVLRSQFENLRSLPSQGSFPESLGAIYLKREITICSTRTSTVSSPYLDYDCKHRQLQIFSSKLRTSPLFTVSLKGVERRSALIPLQAEYCAYIYYGPGFSTGGFLYLSSEDEYGEKRPIAVNSIAFDHRRHALSFGEYRKVDAKVSARFRAEAQKIDVPALLSAGATHYVWVGPEEQVPGFQAGPAGGFLYIFSDPSKNRYFPLVGASEVLDRAVLSGDIGCALLPWDARGAEVEQRLTKAQWVHEGSVVSRVYGLLTPMLGKRPSFEVTIARLQVPDPIHPVVLHGLAFTPRRQVLDTIAAKALAQLSFERATQRIVTHILLELASLGCITRLAEAVRSGDLLEENLAADPAGRSIIVVCWCLVAFVWLKNLFAELCLITGYFRRGWMSDYFSPLSLASWFHSLLFGIFGAWLGIGMARGFERRPDEARPLMAAVGCTQWISVLYACRGFQRFRLGPRILPIFAALTEVGDFVLITLFFAGSCCHAAYALSNHEISYRYIMFSVYRLGFLGDFATREDVLYLPEDDPNAEPTSQTVFQYLSFVIFSFVIAIAMTNIFIGVMSNAFDFHQERVTELFVRSRAKMGLNHMLTSEGASFWCHCTSLKSCHALMSRVLRRNPHNAPAPKEDTLWLCYPKNDEDGANCEISLRGSLHAVRASLAAQLSEIQASIGTLSKESGKPLEASSRRASVASVISDSLVKVGLPVEPRMSSNCHAEGVFSLARQQQFLQSAAVERDAKLLRVTIRRVEGAHMLGEPQDAYCTCQIAGKSHTFERTGACLSSEGNALLWEESLDLPEYTDGDELVFELLDGDGLVGRVAVEADVSSGEWEGELELEDMRGDAKLTLTVVALVQDVDCALSEPSVGSGAPSEAPVDVASFSVEDVDLSAILPGAPQATSS